MQNFALTKAFDTIFSRYDRDNSGTLDKSQLVGFLNGVFQTAKIPITVSDTQAWVLMKILDKNKDGKLAKNELFGMVSNIAGAGGVQNAYGNNMNQGNQGGYNQGYQGGYNQGNQGGYNQGGYNQGGYNQGGFNQGNQGGYNQGGYNQGGYNQGGYNQGGYNQGGYNQY